MEVFSKFFSLILGFVIVFMAPLYLTNLRRTMIDDVRLITEADMFLDQARGKGYIERDELNHFIKKLSEVEGFEKLILSHRRRAVRPIFINGEIGDTKEFFIEIGIEEIRERLRLEGKYYMFVGDELSLSIENDGGGFPFFYRKNITMGGMVENEYTEG